MLDTTLDCLTVVFDIPATPCNGGYIILVLDVTMRLHFKTLAYRGTEGLGLMAANIVETLSRAHRDAKFAVVTYEQKATIVRDFASYRSPVELETFLRQLVFAPVYESNIADGLSKAKEVMLRARASYAMIILISDGEATIDAGIEQTRADELRAAGSKVIAIAVSKNYDNNALEAITRNDPVHYVAESLSFDANVLSAYYKPCNRGPNSIAALRSSTQEACPTEIVFVIDSSNSMNGNYWDIMKTFLIALVEKFAEKTPGVKFGSVLFGDNAQLGFYLSDDLYDIKLRLKALIQMGGETNIARGLSAARSYVFSDSRARKMAILLVDGNPTVEINATYEEADRLRRISIGVKVVGITHTPTKNILERIAGSAESVVRVPNFNNMKAEVEKVAEVVCKSGDNVVNQQQQQQPQPQQQEQPKRQL